MGALTRLPLKVAGDVAYWYLPHIEKIADYHRTAKFVALRRDRDSCIASILAKYAIHNINPIQDHDGTVYARDRSYVPALTESLPKYPADCSLEEAVGQFYDDYYETCEGWVTKMPTRFRIFDMTTLNTEDGVAEILAFCGYDDGNIMAGIHANRRA
jgi:hypothetical protein